MKRSKFQVYDLVTARSPFTLHFVVGLVMRVVPQHSSDLTGWAVPEECLLLTEDCLDHADLVDGWYTAQQLTLVARRDLAKL